MSTTPIRIELPSHLALLAGTGREIQVFVQHPVTQRTVLNALETAYPALNGTIRDYDHGIRRPYLRFFACREDLSCQSPDDLLPIPVMQGAEPFLILGAVAGG